MLFYYIKRTQNRPFYVVKQLLLCRWKVWTNLDEFGRFWTSLNEFGRVLDEFRQIWTSLDEFERVLDKFERVWTSLDESGRVWTSLDEFERKKTADFCKQIENFAEILKILTRFSRPFRHYTVEPKGPSINFKFRNCSLWMPPQPPTPRAIHT